MEYLTAGKILRVDVSHNRITSEPTAKYEEKFIGGRGIDIKILYDAVGPDVGPLDPENVISFGIGPFTGTLVPGSGRTHVMSKSPVSGLLGATSFGGLWAPEVKYAGYDHIVVEGKAEKPVYLFIDNEAVELKDAGNVWGKDTRQTQEVIRQELGDPDIRVVCIGPAGEKLVRYAMVTSGIDDTGGKTGLGAVMGSKNLKAIAVRGTRGIKIADPDRFFELCKQAHQAIMAEPTREEVLQFGTARASDGYSALGMMGFSNWQAATHPEAGGISREAFIKENLYKSYACFGCPMGCRQSYKLEGLGSGALKCSQYDCFTGTVSNPDMRLNYEATILCQKGGIDIVQVSGIIAWLMELYQRGIITEKDTDGIPMEWGSREAIIDIIKKIIQREGIGDILAENFQTIAEKMGKGSEDYFVHTKNLAFQVLEPRGFRGIMLSAAVGSRGEYVRSEPALEMIYPILLTKEGEEREEMLKFLEKQAESIAGTSKALVPGEYEGKAALVKHYELGVILGDMLGHCKWLGPQAEMPMTPERVAEIYSAGKGINMRVDTLMESVERVSCLERAFVVREGLTRDDDKLPKRFYDPLPDGQFKGEKAERAKFEEMKTEYYVLRGWNPETGVPTRKTLERLGLETVADDMENLKKGKHAK